MDLSVGLMAVCLSAPVLLMMVLTKGESRWILFFILVGFVTCAVSADINDYILLRFPEVKMAVFAAYYAPIVEETVKMIPVLIYSLLAVKKGNERIEFGMAVGVGFSILENVYYMVTNVRKISSIEWIFARGFSTALMHALCTVAVAYTLHVAYQHRKMLLTGTLAALTMVITYHSAFNIILQTEYKEIAVFMPIITYSVFLIFMNRERIGKRIKKWYKFFVGHRRNP